MRRRTRLGTLLVLAALAACGSEGLLQGDPYVPDETLATAPATDRSDAATPDAGPADSGFVPIADGGAPAENTCRTARAFGTVSGDTGSQTITTSGTCSEWVSFRATEDNSGVFGAPMAATVTLKPSVGAFDLFTFFDPDHDIVYCIAPTTSYSSPASLKWGEQNLGNNSDDSRTVIAYVRSSGPCPPDAGWSLTAEGNR